MGQISCGDPQWITWWILLAIHTDCGLPLRMSRIQLYWDEAKSQFLEFDGQFGKNCSVEHRAVVSEQQHDKCVPELRRKPVKSHPLSICWGGRQIEVTGAGVVLYLNQPLAALHHNGRECHRLVVTEAWHIALLGHRHYGCPFKIGGVLRW